MKIKGILALTTLLLAACATPPTPIERTPSIAEYQNMEQSLNDAAVSSTLAQAMPALPPSTIRHCWKFNAKKGLSFIGNSSANLDIEPATDDYVSVTVLNNPHASLTSAASGNALALNLDDHLGDKVILYLPEKVQYLQLKRLNQLQGRGTQHLLYLNLSDCNNTRLHATHWTLEYLRITNSFQVTLDTITTPYLLAWIKNSGSVHVQGVIGMRELDAENSQSIEFGWLNSPILNVNLLENSSVSLAGDPAYVNAKIGDHSTLDAKYLNAHRLFIQTAGDATARVTATDALNARATDNSNIYYYHQPITFNPHYADNGSILYMGEHVPCCDLPYCIPLPKRVSPG
jgi:hypothetical protein